MPATVIPVSAQWTAPRSAETRGPVASEIAVKVGEMADSNAWILSLPRGAYTGARTVFRTHIMDYPGHVARTASSLAKMEAATSFEEATPALRAAVTDPTTLGQWMQPVVSAALRAYYTANHLEAPLPDAHAADETKITWLVTDNGTLAVHCAALAPPGPREPEHTLAKVAGSPRGNAEAKDSQWVADRQVLNTHMAGGHVNEVLLVDGGRVFEGLSSNFFTIEPRVSPAAGSSGPFAAWQVRTAPLSDVLTGTVLKLVVAVLESLQVPLVYDHPRLDERDRWAAAFVTSTSRLVCPLARIEFVEGADPALALDPRHPLLVAIADGVQKLVSERAFLVYEP
ncbi:hypothetical protein H9P43_008250 [Blastocladiella emersonii ATCC 22665]|nr:hypothetical protein H9P43_008250 [Blastocladiella emersonii ATCC 22665]